MPTKKFKSKDSINDAMLVLKILNRINELKDLLIMYGLKEKEVSKIAEEIRKKVNLISEVKLNLLYSKIKKIHKP